MSEGRSREMLELLMDCGIFTIEDVINVRPFTHDAYLRETVYLGDPFLDCGLKHSALNLLVSYLTK